MTEHVAVLDAKGRIVMVNDAWKRFGHGNGATELAWVGISYLDICRRAALQPGEAGRNAGFVLAGLETVLDGRLDRFRWEYPCHSPGERRWFIGTATPLTGSGGALVTHTDITERKLYEQEIFQQANHDPLTGLANRRLFEQQARTIISEAKQTGTPVAVLAIDLDGFKLINDSLGHAAGDCVLEKTAMRLRALCRRGDLAVRLGGDEFVLLMPGVGMESVEELAERLMRSFEEPLAVAGKSLHVGASCGWAVFPDRGRTFRELLQCADAEMYRNKGRRKSALPHTNGRPETGPAVVIGTTAGSPPANAA
ncbi:MAG TPA: sensor domain-containing diguanylate cyclase [Thermoanaerobaculia bacterium]